MRRENPDIDTLSARRKWTESNRDRLREQDRIYREQHRAEAAATEARRRARKKSLPDTLTSEQVKDIIQKFNGKCSICSSDYEHLDHFIPLATGHGGTTRENIVPLCLKCNSSKRDKNPFLWSETLPKEERERFDDLVKYLTDINGITDVESYKAHVEDCFKTKLGDD
ncbi:HNH endonuclease [Oceanobacillus sojae]|uniref:HNH endonuclease n=1 Tax=Oceanobacillus sojae TaxID=582851 RepID=UPI00363BF820